MRRTKQFSSFFRKSNSSLNEKESDIMENKFSDSYSIGLYYPMNLGALAIACETVLESNITERGNLTDNADF